MKLKEYDSARRTRGNYKVPRSVQQCIPVEQIYVDGIWKSGDVYSQMWSVSDINYDMMSDKSKEDIQKLYGAVYAGIPSDCWAKFCIISQTMDRQALEQNVLLPFCGQSVEQYRIEYNRLIENRIEAAGSVIQNKYLVVSTNKKSVKEARERLRQIQGHLISALSNLGCTVRQTSNNERLQILHNFFRAGQENQFIFDWDSCTRLGQDFKDYICPDSMIFKRDYIQFNDSYAKVLSVSHYPQKLDDRLISTLLQQVPYAALAIDIVPVKAEDAHREIENARMKVDADKVRFNRKSVDNLDFTATVPYRVQEQTGVVEKYQDDLSNRDQQMFLTLLTIAFFAKTKEELNRQTSAIKTAGSNMNCRFTELHFQQQSAFNTAMPYGLRQIENMRTMVTENVETLVPFTTQEVLVPGGICYGVNAISRNIIVGKRSDLINGNAVVLATSGSGKSAFVKGEILAQFLRFSSARFYILDPENEYAPLVKALGGVVVDISVDSNTYFNPLDFAQDKTNKIHPATAKAEFVLSLCEKIMGKEKMKEGDRSLIDRSLRNIYKPLVQSDYQGQSPTLTDLWQDLKRQRNARAHEIALALEIFAMGSLSVFAQPTNVDMSNRLICFNIQNLGEQLKPVGMLSMLEYINTCVMRNQHKDPSSATWVYFDEIYLLLQEELSAQFLFVSWKRFRKYNAYATGITQNIDDCLSNDTAYAMLANSEFVVMLRQTKDIDHVVELYGLSEPQKNYLKLAHPGQGILKMGNSLIPFVNDYPKDSCIYQLITTKPGEMLQAKTGKPAQPPEF